MGKSDKYDENLDKFKAWLNNNKNQPYRPSGLALHEDLEKIGKSTMGGMTLRGNTWRSLNALCDACGDLSDKGGVDKLHAALKNFEESKDSRIRRIIDAGLFFLTVVFAVALTVALIPVAFIASFFGDEGVIAGALILAAPTIFVCEAYNAGAAVSHLHETANTLRP